MAKILLHTLLILLVTGLVAGGIYLLSVNGVVNLAGQGGHPAGLAQGRALVQPSGADQFHDGGQTGFSLDGLSGVLVQASKIVLITLLVAAVKVITQWLKRRRKLSKAAVI